ncbi:HAD hydrolase-like protein [Fredinandcohnia humi]
MIKYVIFDFDGTLADSTDVFVSAWNSLAKKYNFKEMQYEDLDTLKKLSIKERSKLLNFPMYKLPFIMPQLYKLFKQSLHEIRLIDGVREMLDQLEKRGYKIAVISSNSKENILQFFEDNQIDTISTVLCSSRIHGKDRLINQFLKEHKLETSEVIYVGDEQRDIVACHKTGVKIIWVGWGYDAAEVIKSVEPDYKVYSPDEILRVI